MRSMKSKLSLLVDDMIVYIEILKELSKKIPSGTNKPRLKDKVNTQSQFLSYMLENNKWNLK